MYTAWPLFICFTVSLLLLLATNAHAYLGAFITSKLLIILSITPPLVILIKRQLAITSIVSAPDSNMLKAKLAVVTLFLTLLLLYSHLMAQLGFSPFGIFTFEFTLLYPVLLIFLPWYLRFSSSRLAEPDDEYARLGYCLMRQRKFVWQEHKALLLKSLVKLLFIPIMAGALFDTTEFLLQFNWSAKPLVIIAGIFTFGLTFDLIIATIGYVFASKLLNSDVKSTDPYLSGWLVCLICYPPLLVIYQWIKQQTDNLLWYDWLSADQPLYWFWAFMITATWITYWSSTASFGWRFSNLTWRGLVNTGPYAYTKHPAYIAKNIYWWMHTVPFWGVATSYELMRNLAGMVFVSTVYYLRAKTEERHLMAFKEYQDYAAYIAERGIFSRIKKVMLRARTTS